MQQERAAVINPLRFVTCVRFRTLYTDCPYQCPAWNTVSAFPRQSRNARSTARAMGRERVHRGDGGHTVGDSCSAETAIAVFTLAWSSSSAKRPSLRDRATASPTSYRSRPCLIDLSVCGYARTSREPHFEHFRNRQTSSINVSPGRFKSSPRRLLRFGHLSQLTTIKRPPSLAIVSGPSSPWLFHFMASLSSGRPQQRS